MATAGKVQEADQRLGVSASAAAGAQHVSAKAQAAGAVINEVAGRGRESRGSSASDKYKFGDLTRGLVSEGKEVRGAGNGDAYRFGDFSRGLAAKLTGRPQAHQAPTTAGTSASAASSAPAVSPLAG
jgi:hypothetical protein